MTTHSLYSQYRIGDVGFVNFLSSTLVCPSFARGFTRYGGQYPCVCQPNCYWLIRNSPNRCGDLQPRSSGWRSIRIYADRLAYYRGPDTTGVEYSGCR
jgi:hypothetical protein